MFLVSGHLLHICHFHCRLGQEFPLGAALVSRPCHDRSSARMSPPPPPGLFSSHHSGQNFTVTVFNSLQKSTNKIISVSVSKSVNSDIQFVPFSSGLRQQSRGSGNIHHKVGHQSSAAFLPEPHQPPQAAADISHREKRVEETVSSNKDISGS